MSTMTPVDVEALLTSVRRPGRPLSTADSTPPSTADSGSTHPIRQLKIRRQLVPFEVVGMLWAGGAVAAARPDMAAPVVGLYLTAAVIWWWAKGRREVDPHERARRKRWTTIITVCGTSWLSWAAVSTAGGVRAAVLLTVGAALSLPYWIRHRIPVPGTAEPITVAEPDPAPVTVTETDPIPSLWASTIGGPNGMLAGSTLGEREELPNGAVRYTVHLVPGRQTTDSVFATAAHIASALGRSLAEISPDQHPSGSQALARILISDAAQNPLMRRIDHPGLDAAYDPDTGMAGFATHADGSVARWAFYVPGYGMANGAVFGSTRTGKSALLTTLGKQAAATGVISVWPGCPQGGASFPELLDGAPWPARSRERMLAQLRAAVRVMQIRGGIYGLLGKSLHVPTPTAPCVLLVWDEVHKLFQEQWPGRAEAIELASQLVREGGKFGVAMVAADQLPGQDVFGHDEALRSNLWSRQVYALRNTSNGAAGIIPGLQVDTKNLPATWPDGSGTQGLGVLVGGGSGSLARTWWPGNLPPMGDLPHPVFEPPVLAGLGDMWATRLDAAEDERAANAARYLENLPADVLERLAREDPRIAKALARWRRCRPQSAAAVPTQREPDGDAGGEEWWRLPGFTALRLVSEHPALRTPGARRVHEVICGGVHRTREIIDHADLAESTVHAALKALDEAGLIRRRRHGEWERVA